MSAEELEILPIKDVLPHREPFLFLDEIVELGHEQIWARRTVRADEPQFDGHYPGKPIMPGVLLCETVLQAGAYMMARRMGETKDMKGAPVVTRMNSVKFRRIIKPGDLLDIYAEHKRSMMGAHMLSGKIKCEGKLVCSLDFTVMLAAETPQT